MFPFGGIMKGLVKMKWVKSSFLLLTCSLLASCAVSHAQLHVPGEPERFNDLNSAVVALVEVAEDGNLIGPTCTAFFISPRQLVTAEHCVQAPRFTYIPIAPGISLRVPVENPGPTVGRTAHFVSLAQWDDWIGAHEDDRPDNPAHSTVTVVAADEDADVAILELSDGQPSSEHWLSIRDYQEHGVPQVGEQVYATSMPSGAIWILSEGIISRMHLTLQSEVLIYHQARIGHGSSGSPLMDRHGRVIGINVQINRGNIVGIAVPSTHIATLLSILETEREIEELDRQHEQQQQQVE
jgi:hypothetical protein